MLKRAFIIVAVLVALALALVVRYPKTLQALPTFGGPSKGFSFSPAKNDVAGFFDKAASGGTMVTWAGDWQQLANKQSAPYVVTAEAKKAGLDPVMILATHTEVNGRPREITPLSEANISAMAQMAADYAAAQQPHYLGLGIEVNRIKDIDTTSYDNFLTLFQRTVGLVKSVSPQTKVFTTFQLEQLKGFRGGLFGGVDDPNAAEWSNLNDFPTADAIGFTTYPYLVFHSPSDVPDGYYTEIRDKTKKPILFTEIGWPSRAVANGWNSTPVAQADFISRLFKDTRDVKPVALIWSFLYDQPVESNFSTDGLFDDKGQAKDGWQVWQRGR